MATQPIDYAAIAKQYGATSSIPPPAKPQNKIDYAAIAKQYGSISYEPPTSQLVTDTAQSGPMDAIKQYAGQALDAVGSAVKEMGKGALKSAAQPAAELSGAINKIPVVGEKLAPKVGVTAFKKATTAENIPQRIGAGIEQAAEMAATGGPLKAGAEQLAARAPNFIEMLMRPAARIGAEAANVGANAGAHGEPVAPAAAIGGAGAVASEVLPWMIKPLQKSAQSQYAEVLAPTTRANKNIAKRVVPQLLERDQVNSAAGLAKKAESKLDVLGPQIDQAVSNVPASVKPNPQNIIDHLDNYKKQFAVQTPTQSVIADPDAIQKANDLQDIVRQFGPDVSYQSLNKLRQIWDTKVAKAGGYAGKSLTEGSAIDAQREGANAIRAELSRQSPDIAKINKEFHFWKGVSDVLGDTAERRTGQSGGLVRNVLPWLAGSAGLAHGGATIRGGMEAAGAAAIMATVHHLIESGFVKTLSAVAKNELANAITRGDAQTVFRVASRFGAAANSQNQRGRGKGLDSQ